MKAALIYGTLYGSTRRYAQFIAQALEADLISREKVKPEALLAYDVLIFGGGLYSGGICGSHILRDHFDELQDKTLFVFSVGLTPPECEGYYQAVRDQNFSREMQERIRFYHFRGAFERSKLKFKHRAMVNMIWGSLKKRSDLSREERIFLAAIDSPVDAVDLSLAHGLIADARSALGK